METTVIKAVEDGQINLSIHGRVLNVELCYPRIEDNRPNVIELGLMDVRAADSIRVIYNFELDGWQIQQAQYFHWPQEGVEMNCEGWTTVAFIQAWANKK